MAGPVERIFPCFQSFTSMTKRPMPGRSSAKSISFPQTRTECHAMTSGRDSKRIFRKEWNFRSPGGTAVALMSSGIKTATGLLLGQALDDR